MTCQSGRAWPGGSSTLRPICTRRSVFVYVPSFSRNEVAGSTTSANSAVSVRKMSCTTRNSSAASALRTLLTFGSERNGFSPIMYMPRTPPLSALPTISVTVRPGLSSSSRPHASRNFSCACGVVHALVVGEHHRDQPRVGGALDVVLPAQRVQAGARLADVARDRAHGDQAARVVGARRVLGDPHAPVDDARARLAPQPGDVADRVGVDAADLRRALGRVLACTSSASSP